MVYQLGTRTFDSGIQIIIDNPFHFPHAFIKNLAVIHALIFRDIEKYFRPEIGDIHVCYKNVRPKAYPILYVDHIPGQYPFHESGHRDPVVRFRDIIGIEITNRGIALFPAFTLI